MYNDQLVYKVVIWAFFGISLSMVTHCCSFIWVLQSIINHLHIDVITGELFWGRSPYTIIILSRTKAYDVIMHMDNYHLSSA